MTVSPRAVRDLLDATVLRGRERDACVEQALDPKYWRSLSPTLHVEDAVRPAFVPPKESDVQTAVEGVADRGYFHLHGAIPPALLAAANHAIDVVVAAGWPASFACAFDELLWCGHVPAVRAVMTGALGEGFEQIPRLWIHVVRPVAGASGWRPHQDGDHGRRLSAWVALTDATLDNGCMHVLPRQPAIAPLLERMARKDTFAVADVAGLLHAARPLPAAAGDVLGWDFALWHWGGEARRGALERRALSLEFLAEGESPVDGETPLLPRDRLPPLHQRVLHVARGIVDFRSFEPGLAKFQEVARAILTRVTPT